MGIAEIPGLFTVTKYRLVYSFYFLYAKTKQSKKQQRIHTNKGS